MPFSLRVPALIAAETRAHALGGGPPSPAGSGLFSVQEPEKSQNNWKMISSLFLPVLLLLTSNLPPMSRVGREIKSQALNESRLKVLQHI